MVLVFDRQIEQHAFLDQHVGQRRKEPGAQAVGIESGDHHQRRVTAFGQVGHQVGFKQGGPLEVLQQPLAYFGRTAGAAAHHQSIAQGAFQRSHPL